ncbi:MAG TPA: SRPBCC family protein [Kofleriaceae bacterium]|nr:SRPBCC family protein [Kofleriaceae bacterium]
MSKLKLGTGAPNEIVMTREFDAPRRLVITAMTTPALIKRWLGGVRAEVLSAEVDLRVGGTYRYVLRPRQGKDFAFGGTYREISDERVVQTESFDDYPGESTVTTTFAESGGRTALRIVIAFDSQATRDIVLGTGMADGAGESYDALDAVLAGLAR